MLSLAARAPAIGSARFGAPVVSAPSFDARRGLKAFRNQRAFNVCLVPQTIEHVVEHVRLLRVAGSIDVQACWSVGPRHTKQPDGIHTPRKQHRGSDQANHGGSQL